MCRNSLKNTGIEHNEIKRLNSHQRSEQKLNDLQLPPTPTFNTVFVSSMVNAFNVMCRLCHNLIYHLNLNICLKIDFVQMTNFVIHFVVSSSSFCVFFSFWNFVFEFSVSERNVKKWRKKKERKRKEEAASIRSSGIDQVRERREIKQQQQQPQHRRKPWQRQRQQQPQQQQRNKNSIKPN